MLIRRKRVLAFVVVVLAFVSIASIVRAQAVMGTAGGSGSAIVFPSPGTGLPTPTQTVVAGLPVDASIQGVSYYGSDNALLADTGNNRVFVVKVSTASLVATIPTGVAGYDGSGTIAVAPGQNFALACGSIAGNDAFVHVIAAPFSASSTITSVALPSANASFQTQAIVFNAAGRAFVSNRAGISVLDPPYASMAFTIPESNEYGGAIAITPDGNTLLSTDLASANVHIYSAPFSASSTPVTLSISGASTLDGIVATPDSTKVLVVDGNSFFPGLWAISPPYNASSTVEAIALFSTFGEIDLEDIGISADSQLAVLTGGDGTTEDTPFVQAPFTTAGATLNDVLVSGGRGAGSVRFVPPGQAPGSPVASSIAPTSGSAAGGTAVTIIGSNFVAGAAAAVGGVSATGVSVSDSNHMAATVPALSPGTLNYVIVTNPSNLTGTLPNGWFADFLDVPQGFLFHAYVEKLIRNGITAGCGGGDYCPTSAVTRAQMAVFLLKTAHGSAFVPPPCIGIFPDVECTPTPAFAVNWIEELFHEGITGGCGGGDYCPSNSITRAQMAVFLLKAFHGSSYAPPACTGIFADVECAPTPAFAVNWIEELYHEDVTGGCSSSPLDYCPDAAVNRGQMAVFLAKMFGLP